MKTKAKYVIVILFLCTIPLYFCRMIGWKDGCHPALRCDSLWNGKQEETLLSEG